MTDKIGKQLELMIEGIPLGRKGTTINVDVCDQGHYGVSYCGNCYYHLQSKSIPKICPECGYYFKDIKDTSSCGGSDY